MVSPILGSPRRSGSSAVEQLPQHVVHRLAVLRLGRLARRWAGGRGRGWAAGSGRGRLRPWLGALASLARLRSRRRRLLAEAAAQALLQQVADGLAELAAEQIAGLAVGAAACPSYCRRAVPVPPWAPPEQPAQAAEAGAVLARTGPCPSRAAWHRRRRDCPGCPASPDRSAARPTAPRSSRECRSRRDRRCGPGLRWSSRVSARRGNRSAWCRGRWCRRRSSCTSGPTRLRSVVAAWPLSILNEAESCERSVACCLVLLPAGQRCSR